MDLTRVYTFKQTTQSLLIRFDSPVKRYILNRCICRMYSRKGLVCPTPVYEPKHIIFLLNVVMKTRLTTCCDALVKVRRQLFREAKIRKNPHPGRNKAQLREQFNFKAKRTCSKTHFKPIRRGYLKEARSKVKMELLMCMQRQSENAKNCKTIAPDQLDEIFDGITKAIDIMCKRQSQRIHERKPYSRTYVMHEMRQLKIRGEILKQNLVSDAHREFVRANIDCQQAALRSLLNVKAQLALIIRIDEGLII